MPRSEWFKPSCEHCNAIFDAHDNRYTIVFQNRSTGYQKNNVIGHYCETCFKKITRR